MSKEIQICAARSLGDHLGFDDNHANLFKNVRMGKGDGRKFLVCEQCYVVLPPQERRYVVSFAGRLDRTQTIRAINGIEVPTLVGDKSFQRQKKSARCRLVIALSAASSPIMVLPDEVGRRPRDVCPRARRIR